MDLVNKDVHLNSWNAVDGILFFCLIWHTAARMVGFNFLYKEVSLL